MSQLNFDIIGSRVEPYAATPTLMFRLRAAESSGERIHAVLLRCQIKIEPRRRNYARDEAERLYEIFGEPERWGETLQTVLWTHAALMVPSFEQEIEIDLPVACTYDLEVAATKYFHALENGEIPLRFLFSGTIFTKGESGVKVEPVPWEKETVYQLPVQLWRGVMDRYFPGSAWLRLRRDNVDALLRFKGARALATWDDAIATLLAEAGERQVYEFRNSEKNRRRSFV
jgi:hypothetical protein